MSDEITTDADEWNDTENGKTITRDTLITLQEYGTTIVSANFSALFLGALISAYVVESCTTYNRNLRHQTREVLSHTLNQVNGLFQELRHVTGYSLKPPTDHPKVAGLFTVLRWYAHAVSPAHVIGAKNAQDQATDSTKWTKTPAHELTKFIAKHEDETGTVSRVRLTARQKNHRKRVFYNQETKADQARIIAHRLEYFFPDILAPRVQPFNASMMKKNKRGEVIAQVIQVYDCYRITHRAPYIDVDNSDIPANKSKDPLYILNPDTIDTYPDKPITSLDILNG